MVHAFVIGTSHYPVERYGARVQWLLALALWAWGLRITAEMRSVAARPAA